VRELEKAAQLEALVSERVAEPAEELRLRAARIDPVVRIQRVARGRIDLLGVQTELQAEMEHVPLDGEEGRLIHV
jgi:hypothetical protein